MSSSKLFSAYRGDADYSSSSACDFSGTNFSARFSSTKTILLKSVLFYDRKPEDDENLGMRFGKKSSPPKTTRKPVIFLLQISESAFYYPQKKDIELVKFCSKLVVEIDVKDFKKDDVFAFKLPSLIEIPKNVIFDITFQLNGVEEYVTFHCLPRNQNYPKKLRIHGCDAEVSVHMPSGQCAGFVFQIQNEEHKEFLVDRAADDMAESNQFDCFTVCSFF